MSGAADMIVALEFERDGYLKYGREDRAAECDKQIKVWRKRVADESKAVEESATLGESATQPDHIRKIAVTLGSLRDERNKLAEGDERLSQIDEQITYWEAQLKKDGVTVDDVETTSADLTGVETATVKTAAAKRPAKRASARPSPPAKRK